MLFLQASIGAVNDVVDAPSDRVAKPDKPIPVGAVPPSTARWWSLAAFGLGMVLAAPSGAVTAFVAAVGAGLGYAYDIRLSRTPLSWLPLALALPLLPIFGWLGARGNVPTALLALVPVAVLAGAALLIANGLVDVEGDAMSGKPTAAVRIGGRRAWLIHAATFAVAIELALAWAPAVPASSTSPAYPAALADPGSPAASAEGALLLRLAWTLGVPLGVVGIALGAWLLSAVRPAVRERGWELEGIATAVLGLGWLAGVVLASSGPTGH